MILSCFIFYNLPSTVRSLGRQDTSPEKPQAWSQLWILLTWCNVTCNNDLSTCIKHKLAPKCRLDVSYENQYWRWLSYLNQAFVNINLHQPNLILSSYFTSVAGIKLVKASLLFLVWPENLRSQPFSASACVDIISLDIAFSLEKLTKICLQYVDYAFLHTKVHFLDILLSKSLLLLVLSCKIINVKSFCFKNTTPEIWQSTCYFLFKIVVIFYSR